MATVGLKNLYFAEVTADDDSSTTYGTPTKIAGAISVDIKPSLNTATLYGDDAPFATESSMTDIVVTIEAAELSVSNYNSLLGHTGGVAKASDVAPYVALLFESQKHDGQTRYVKLYKGKFSEAQETYNTKGESVEFTTPKIEGHFVARQSDGAWKEIKDAAAGDTTWYASV